MVDGQKIDRNLAICWVGWLKFWTKINKKILEYILILEWLKEYKNFVVLKNDRAAKYMKNCGFVVFGMAIC